MDSYERTLQGWEPTPFFVQRLSAENAWSLDYSLRVIEEYKKFIHLACISPTAVTPSDEIDQVWHLHIIHMDDYEKLMRALSKRIVHGPTAGGEEEDRRYLKQYVDTLVLYANVYRASPPIDIWPSPTERFSGRFIRLNMNRHVYIPTKSLPFLKWGIGAFYTMIATLLIMLLSVICLGQEKDFPSKPSSVVWDPSDILSPTQEDDLEKLAGTVSSQHEMEIRVVALSTTSPYTSASFYAEDLYHSWELGSAETHNGLLFLVTTATPESTDKRDLCRIMTGWGTMSLLPDTVVINRIKHEHMMNHLPGNPYLALKSAMNETSRVLAEKGLIPGKEEAEVTASTGWSTSAIVWTVLIVVIIIVLISLIASGVRTVSKGGGSSRSSSSSSSSSCGGGGGCGGGGCGGGGCGGGGCGS